MPEVIARRIVTVRPSVDGRATVRPALAGNGRASAVRIAAR